MALHFTTQVNFDIDDGSASPNTDLEGVVHLTAIKKGSAVVFRITPQFPSAGGPVTITGMTFAATWRSNNHDGPVVLEAATGGVQGPGTGVITEFSATELEIRINDTSSMPIGDEGGVWDLEATYDDLATLDHPDRIAEGSYHMTREATR